MMWMDKIRNGVLAVETESGLRYIQPSFMQRIRLIWTFRHFAMLPQEVLQRHERRLIDSLCRKGEYLANWNGHGDLSEHRIGVIERLNRQNCANSMSATQEDRFPSGATQTILPRPTS
jgi:hypothetical protein